MGRHMPEFPVWALSGHAGTLGAEEVRKKGSQGQVLQAKGATQLPRVLQHMHNRLIRSRRARDGRAETARGR